MASSIVKKTMTSCKCPTVQVEINRRSLSIICFTHMQHFRVGCRKPIIGRSLTAMGRVWHPEHFCCHHCHTPFAGSQFYEKDGLPYCQMHYEQLFGRPCGKCGKPVTHNGVESLGKIWHKEHFCCQVRPPTPFTPTLSYTLVTDLCAHVYRLAMKFW